MSAKWLRERRKKAGLSQEELAARLQVFGFDVTAGAVSHWENGRYNLPLHEPEFRRALASILRMSVREILISAGYEISDNEPYSEEGLRAAEIIEQLSPQQRRLALGILEQFLAANGKR